MKKLGLFLVMAASLAVVNSQSFGYCQDMTSSAEAKKKAKELAKRGNDKALVCVKKFQDLLIAEKVPITKASAEHRKLDNEIRNELYG